MKKILVMHVPTPHGGSQVTVLPWESEIVQYTFLPPRAIEVLNSGGSITINKVKFQTFDDPGIWGPTVEGIHREILENIRLLKSVDVQYRPLRIFQLGLLLRKRYGGEGNDNTWRAELWAICAGLKPPCDRETVVSQIDLIDSSGSVRNLLIRTGIELYRDPSKIGTRFNDFELLCLQHGMTDVKELWSEVQGKFVEVESPRYRGLQSL